MLPGKSVADYTKLHDREKERERAPGRCLLALCKALSIVSLGTMYTIIIIVII